jgi:hypothetical protein
MEDTTANVTGHFKTGTVFTALKSTLHNSGRIAMLCRGTT